MKTGIILSTILAVIIAMPAMAQRNSSKKASAVELSFNYQKQAGAGSNQWAVWIENSEGKVVRTLTVTSFTSKGRGGRRGYTFRPTCVPTWVKNAKAEEMTDEQIDAVTGATPSQSGIQTYTWDFKDADGKEVPAGDYKICMEATLYFNSILLYSGTFSTKDKAGDIKLTFRTSFFVQKAKVILHEKDNFKNNLCRQFILGGFFLSCFSGADNPREGICDYRRRCAAKWRDSS